MAVGCAEERVHLPIIEQSERLVLRGPSDIAVCGGTFQYMEDFVVDIQDVLAPTASPPLVTHTWVPSGLDVDVLDFCNARVGGCAWGADSYHHRLVSKHELVHASRPGTRASIFEEGVATMFGEFNGSEIASRDELLQELIAPTGEFLDARLYERSGRFVSFLVAIGGVKTFFEFDSRLRTEEGYDGRHASSWDPLLADIYGLNFEELWSEYEGYPDCSPYQFHWSLRHCPEIDSSDEGVLKLEPLFSPEREGAEYVVADFACDSPEVVGPDGSGRWFRSREFVIQVPTVIGVWFRLVGDVRSDSYAFLSPCGNCWGGDYIALGDRRRGASGPWLGEHERYVLTLIQSHGDDGDQPGELGIRVSY